MKRIGRQIALSYHILGWVAKDKDTLSMAPFPDANEGCTQLLPECSSKEIQLKPELNPLPLVVISRRPFEKKPCKDHGIKMHPLPIHNIPLNKIKH